MHHLLHLKILRDNSGRKQPAEVVSVALPLAKGEAFVVMRIAQQSVAARDGERPGGDGHVLRGGVFPVDILNSAGYVGGGLGGRGGFDQNAAVWIDFRSERGEDSRGGCAEGEVYTWKHGETEGEHVRGVSVRFR